MTNSVRSGWLIVLILLVSSFGPLLRVSADEGDDDYKLASGLYADKRWTLAEEAFQKVLRDYPGHPRSASARLYLSLSQVQQKKYGRALVSLREFVRKHPQSPDIPHAEYRIAECSYHLGNLEEAVQDFSAFTTGHAKDPLNEWAWAYLGDAQRRLKQYDGSAVSLRKSLELFPRGRMADEARFGLAQSTEQLGKTDDAIALYRTAARNTTSRRADAAQLQIGNLLFGAGKYVAAIQEYELVADRFPQSSLVPTSRLNAGFSYYESDDFDQAEASFEQAADGFKGNQETRTQFITAGYWKGLSLKARQKYDAATTVLSEVARNAGMEPLAESILYQLADCTFRSGNLSTAQQRFLVVTNRWPQGQYGDHSLYFATECALELATNQTEDGRQRLIAEAGLLLDKFERDYQTSRIHFSHDMQRGHFLVLRGEPGDVQAAEELYNRIITRTTKAQTRGEARFELARLLKNKGDSKAALAMISPLARDMLNKPAGGFPEALILYSHLALAEGELSAVQEASDSYLQSNVDGDNRDQAWAYLAVAACRAKDWQESDRAIGKLLSDHMQSRVVFRTIHTVAEHAYDGKDWDEAIRFFSMLEKAGEESQFFPLAHSGLGWSFFNRSDFETAAMHFRVVVEKTPKHESAPEAGFKIGECLLQSGKKTEAAQAFQDALAEFQPARRAFLAGIQAARVYVDLADVKSANAVYAAVDKARNKLGSPSLFTAEEY
ncbi:MAG: tetratricopeptide repeat protein, partial [Planctomycetaceae bacterium]